MKDVDLNLLPSLQALLELRNVSRAAERMHLSQPAMSAALGRLRRHFNDELLVRSGRGYGLTPFAQALAPRVDQALTDVQDAMQLRTDFDPADSDRTFVLAASDYVTGVLIRHLRARIATEAPGITVDFVPTSRARLRPGLEAFSDIDLLVGPMGFDLGGSSRQLFRDEFVVVLDPANPLLQRPVLTVGDIATAPQAVGEFGGSIITPPMQFFQRLGQSPAIAARVAGLQALPSVVEGTDLVALVPRMLAARAARCQGITVVEFAEDLEVPLVEAMYWHPLQTSDPANLWLRSLMQRAVQDLDEPGVDPHPVRIEAAPRD
ncbi:LysR family transcriptional regulator [Kocuria sp. SM24M-10]|uniref:LysR family transcriptional regulator n=1 Tax=Kocuria sp. SM24M-10 TaxID=1660349 RepID=UPI00064A0222|nr:LysR family transcriptional regulator [Kocuria sp. SM24M-10]KLU09554.1 LysR family transcriptional regulator [Kocuria sp. SM24M-10]